MTRVYMRDDTVILDSWKGAEVHTVKGVGKLAYVEQADIQYPVRVEFNLPNYNGFHTYTKNGKFCISRTDDWDILFIVLRDKQDDVLAHLDSVDYFRHILGW